MNTRCFQRLYLGLLILSALPLYAQGGCTDSPEGPTAILGLVGAAGLFYRPVKVKLLSLWRNR